jgi:hypothetical protein
VCRRNPYSMGMGPTLGHTCTTASVIDHQSSSTGTKSVPLSKKVVDSQLEVRSFGGGRGGGADPARDRGGEVDESNEATCMFVDVDRMVSGSQAYGCHQGLREISQRSPVYRGSSSRTDRSPAPRNRSDLDRKPSLPSLGGFLVRFRAGIVP